MKKGVTLVSLIIVIIVMGILAGIVVVTGFNSNESITINTFAMELLDVQNGVDEYYYRYEKHPVGNDYILDTESIESLEQFSEETITNSKINFKLVDLGLIGINSTEFGKGKGTDVYVLSEKTGIVYYIQGVKFEDKTYYTYTDKLYDITNPNSSDLVSTQDIKVYNVIFRPSTVQYTNEPITVDIKIPKIATIDSITTTNDKSISGETIEGLYKKIQINQTSSDKTGNYKITVNYTYRGAQKTSEYEVTNYDASLPSITFTETVNEDIKTVKVIVDNNGSQIKNIKYEEKLISDTTYFNNYGKAIRGNEIKLGKDTPCSVCVETVVGISQIIYVIPESWKPNITNIVNGVPIPKGFVASSATGENTKNGGLVIYEGTTAVTDETVENARLSRNQYVWVPVDDFSKFVRKDYKTISEVINSEGKYNDLGTTDVYWETIVDSDNMPLPIQDLNCISSETLAEVQEMYKSVKEYGGFYIARYESGIDKERTSGNDKLPTEIYSVMGKIPCTYISWNNNNATNNDMGGVVEIARSKYLTTNINYGVISTLTYGVQWDRTINWWLEVEAKTGTGETITSITNSTTYGNYGNNQIVAGSLNKGAKKSVYSNINGNVTMSSYENVSNTDAETDGAIWALSTGALELAKVNNIYDMAGNMLEWTMEHYSLNKFVLRGGMYTNYGSSCPVAYRSARRKFNW